MRTHTLVGAGLTALLLGAFAAGGVTVAGNRDVAKQATAAAGKAQKALAKNDAAQAIALAESAVALAPQDASYRMLLAQGYLKAGRFVSAGQAFADVLSLSPDGGADVGKAALNLALAQIAQGQWEVARKTLVDHAAVIPARDHGLALALAGDPNGAVELLMTAARAPEADARTRQNLGLALALSGRWSDARTVISADMTPEQANARMMAWIDFAKPTSASDQVAKLLGVIAAKDDGQPAAITLNAPVPVVPVEAAPVETAAAPAAAPAPEPAAAPAAAPVAVADATPIEAPQITPLVSAVPGVLFAERREVVQALPAAVVRPARMIAAKGAFKTPAVAAAARPVASGAWFVQLGAYDNAGVARDAWKRATRRYVALSAHTPAGAAFKARSGAFYRLSVGGFARADAVALCRGYRAKGGACFVRAGAGDQIAQWAKPAKVQTARVQPRVRGAGVQVAAR